MARLAVLFTLSTCTLALLAPPTRPGRTATLLHQSVPDVPDADPAGSFRYDNSDSISPLEKKQAFMNTANWCLERCIKLGHCEVFEDLNKMSTAQVQDFCKACVLSGEATADECDVSLMFAPDAPWAGKQPDDVELQPN